MGILRLAKESSAPAEPAADKIRLYAIDATYGSYVNVMRPYWKGPSGSGGQIRAFFDPAAIDADIIWDGDNTRDLGSTSKYTKDIFLKGSIKYGTAASRLIPGATSFSVRDNGNTRDNLLVGNGGSTSVFLGLSTGGGAGGGVYVGATNYLHIDSGSSGNLTGGFISRRISYDGTNFINESTNRGSQICLLDTASATGEMGYLGYGTGTVINSFAAVNKAVRWFADGKVEIPSQLSLPGQARVFYDDLTLTLNSSYQTIGGTERIDNAGIASGGLITITDATAGTWVIAAEVAITATATESDVHFRINHNGTSYAFRSVTVPSGGYGGYPASTTFTLFAIVSATAGQTLSVEGKQPAGTPACTVAYGQMVAFRIG